MEDMESNNANNAPDVPNEPHPDPHIDSSVVAEGPLHSDADRERRSTSVETTMWPPAIVSTAPANPVDAHAHPEPPRQNTRSSSWHEVLSTDDATLQERPITVGDQLNADDDDLICAFVDNRKKKKKKKKNK